MLRSCALFVVSCALLLPVAARAATPPVDSVAVRVDRYLARCTGLGRFSGAVLVARGDAVWLRRGYGWADVERRTPFTPDTPQEVASVSKMFTAMAALKLRDRGRLALDDSLAMWLPGCPGTWRGITIRELIHHTSGIPDYEEALEIGSPRYMQWMGRRDAADRIMADAARKPLDFVPGTKFHYSNTGYIVLARVVERVARQPFADFVTRELLRPAGMTHSGVFDGGAGPAGLAKGYTYEDLGWARMLAGVALDDGHLKPVPHLLLAPPIGDAELYSTVGDLLRWSRVMDGGALVPASEAAEVFTPGLENYGFGWFIDHAFDRTRYRHNGVLPGHLTDFIKFPDESLTIVLVSNLDRTRMDRVARDVSAIVLGTPYDPPVYGVVDSLTTTRIAALDGDYAMSDGTPLKVRFDPPMLVAELKDHYTAGLIPLGPTEFYMPLGDGRAIFTLGPDGRAIRVNMRYSGEDHVAERVAR
ncbi:MAG TPA: serine hydrolase domain-containing protein [Dongiaceae bacterium]|nr:serine hydrolase domain-containing protein [Dongiaceae bacterium]